MLIAGILLSVLILIFALWLWAVAPGRGADFSLLKQYDYAHRGLHDIENGVPENSAKGFRLAVEHGFGIELDLQLTKDDKVVVHHDHTLKRSCGEDAAVSGLTLEELQQYRLFGTEEKVPLFSEVLQIMGGRTPMIVELKGYNDTARLCQLVMRELRGYDGPYCIESFDPRIVRWFMKNHPEIIRGQLMYRMKKGENGLNHFSAFFARNMLTNFFNRPHFEAYAIGGRDIPSMAMAKGIFGMQEVSWTLRTQEQYDRAKGLDSLCIFENIRPVHTAEKALGEKRKAAARAAVQAAKREG